MPTTGPSFCAYELDEARRLEDLALAVAGEVVGEALDAVVAVLLLRARLGDADRCHLGLGVGHARDAVVVDRRRVEAGEPLGDHDALAEADVGELQGRDEVADGRDRRDVGLAVLVDLDEAALHLDADLLVAELLGHRAPAHGDEEHVGLERLAVLQRDLHALLGALDAGEPRPELEADLALAEGPLERLGRLLVLERHEVGQGLDDGDLGAEGLPDAGELAADDTAAQHDHRRRARCRAGARGRCSPRGRRRCRGRAGSWASTPWPGRCGGPRSAGRRPRRWSGPARRPMPST